MEPRTSPTPRLSPAREIHLARRHPPSGRWPGWHDRLVSGPGGQPEWRARYKNSVADALERVGSFAHGSGLVEGLRYEGHPKSAQGAAVSAEEREAAREMRRRRILIGTGALAIVAVVVFLPCSQRNGRIPYVQGLHRVRPTCRRTAERCRASGLSSTRSTPSGQFPPARALNGPDNPSSWTNSPGRSSAGRCRRRRLVQQGGRQGMGMGRNTQGSVPREGRKEG
jgi:hypothetical protein